MIAKMIELLPLTGEIYTEFPDPGLGLSQPLPLQTFREQMSDKRSRSVPLPLKYTEKKNTHRELFHLK